jgi:chemotaxis protein methyltransferase CheR
MLLDGPELGPSDFQRIAALVRRSCGLDLKAGKEDLVSARLRRILRDGGFGSFRAYLDKVSADLTGAALAGLIDALVTNHTAFLREPDHFDFLRERVWPELGSRSCIEMWSAGCSTGEEPWTLACLAREALPGRFVRILATDISGIALDTAETALYPATQMHGMPRQWLQRYFLPEGDSFYRVAPEVRSMVSFRRLNLTEPCEWRRQLPIILCRNVLIYFDRATQEQTVKSLGL